MSILGNRVVRLEDPRFLLGEGRYVENLELEGALSVTFVRSPLAHARVNAIDASEAEALPNVQVFTGADIDAHPFGPPPHWHITAGMERPLVARDVVRFAGDIVAVVVTRAPRVGIRRGGAGDGGLRPPADRPLGRGGAEGRGAALPGHRVERRESRRLEGARRRAVRRLRPRRLGRAPEPAAGGRPARAALGGSRGRRRRPADALGHLADAAHGQDGGRRAARARPGAGAGREPGRGRRVRREDDRARRRARRVARAQAGTARAVDRDAHREHARAPAGARSAALVHARRDAGRASCSRTGSRCSATPARTPRSAPTSPT